MPAVGMAQMRLCWGSVCTVDAHVALLVKPMTARRPPGQRAHACAPLVCPVQSFSASTAPALPPPEFDSPVLCPLCRHLTYGIFVTMSAMTTSVLNVACLPHAAHQNVTCVRAGRENHTATVRLSSISTRPDCSGWERPLDLPVYLATLQCPAHAAQIENSNNGL